MCVFSFDDGMVAESWYAWLAFRIRVSMSAIGSVIVRGVVPLSPRFLTRWRGPFGDRWCLVGEVMERPGGAGLERPRCRVPPRARERWGSGSFYVTSWTC